MLNIALAKDDGEVHYHYKILILGMSVNYQCLLCSQTFPETSHCTLIYRVNPSDAVCLNFIFSKTFSRIYGRIAIGYYGLIPPILL